MPTEISFSAGLTFRVTDSGVEKFDINRKQPKIISTFTQVFNVTDATGDYLAEHYLTTYPPYHGTKIYRYPLIVYEYQGGAGFYTNVDPADGFLLHSINFPSSLNSGELQVNSSISGSTTANGQSAHMFHGIYDKWVNVNGGAILRTIFSPQQEGWVGTQLLACTWNPNLSYPANSSYRFLVQNWVITAIGGIAGNTSTNTSSNINQDFNSPPGIYAMSNGLQANGTGKIRMTHMDFYLKTFICA